MGKIAYRINKIARKRVGTFDIQHDKDIVEYLSPCITPAVLTHGGIIAVPVEMAEKLIDELGDSMNLRVKLMLEDDILWVRQHKKKFILYACY